MATVEGARGVGQNEQAKWLGKERIKRREKKRSRRGQGKNKDRRVGGSTGQKEKVSK
jgi:hypothetical protein